MYVCMHLCMHVCMYACVHIHIYSYIYIYIYIYIYSIIHTHTHKHTYIYTYIYIYIYIYIYVYRHNHKHIFHLCATDMQFFMRFEKSYVYGILVFSHLRLEFSHFGNTRSTYWSSHTYVVKYTEETDRGRTSDSNLDMSFLF